MSTPIETAIFAALRRAAEDRLDTHTATFHLGPRSYAAFRRARASSLIYSPLPDSWCGSRFVPTAEGEPEVVVFTHGDDQVVRRFLVPQ